MRCQGKADLGRRKYQRGVQAAQDRGPEVLPKLVMIAQVLGIQGDAGSLGLGLEPRIPQEIHVFCREANHLWKLRLRPDLRGVFPIAQVRRKGSGA